MQYLIKLISLLIKTEIKFGNPKKSALVIYDDTSIKDFKNVLRGRDYFIMQTRAEKINKIFFSWKILLLVIKNYRNNLLTSYLVSLLNIMETKLVITTIDNCFKFSEIAKILHKRITFIAVQNAARYDFDRNRLLFKLKRADHDDNKKFFIPNYYCFGQYEVKNCKKNNIKAINFYKAGSLRLSNYLHYLREKKIKIIKNKYDVALISEASLYKDKLWSMERIDKSFGKLAKFAIIFCKKHKLRFVFVTKREKGIDQEKELKFYENNLDKNEFNFLIKNAMRVNKEKYQSYKTIHESNIIVGMCSTLLRDKLTLRGKILACNFTPLNFYDFPISGVCLMKNYSYNHFEKKMLENLKMSNKKYFSLIRGSKLIKLNKKNLTFQIINRHIDQIIQR